MSCRSLSFAALAVWNSLQHICSSDSLSAFQGLLKTFYVKSLFRQTSACIMSPRFSTCTLQWTPSNLFLHISYRFIFAEYLNSIEGTPPMSSSQNKRALNSILLLLLLLLLLSDGVTLKTSPRGWVSTAVFKTDTFQSVQ